MSNYEVAELTWENGHLAMHELGTILPTAQTKTTWDGTGETLESIVNQATSHSQNINLAKNDHHQNHLGSTSSIAKSYNVKCGENLSHLEMAPGFANKRVRSEYSDQERADRSACASASATFCRDNDTTMMTWASLESPRSLKTEFVVEDSACHDGSENRDKEHETKGETVRSHTTRRSRDADVHNRSERRRRDRINQRMKALQKLVPNANKTDKASVLDEVIAYLKQLQAQVQMMSVRNTPQIMMPLGMQQQLQMMSVRNMPQMMMPLGMQQQLQMSLLARMGMGVGLGMNTGMLDMTTLPQIAIHPNPATATAPTFIQPPFVVPPMIQSHILPQSVPSQGATNTSVPFNDPYCAFLAQSMNMELYNKMAAAAHQQAVNQAPKATSGDSKSNHVQGE